MGSCCSGMRLGGVCVSVLQERIDKVVCCDTVVCLESQAQVWGLYSFSNNVTEGKAYNCVYAYWLRNTEFHRVSQSE